MKVQLLTAAGCIFWLLLLALGGMMVTRFGFLEEGSGAVSDGALLLAIPFTMLIWTVALGWFSRRRQSSTFLVLISSVAAIVAAMWWAGIYGQSV